MLALRTAAALGLRPVFLTSDPGRYDGLADAEPEIIRCDTNSAAALRQAVGAWAPAEMAGVTSTSDFYLAAAAELAAEFGLPGASPDAIRACRDKAVTRERLAATGVAQPRFTVVTAADAGPGVVAAAVRTAALPCVVKPVDDSGSQGVRVCRTVAEAREHCAELLVRRINVRGQPVAPMALVEEYLPGPEYSVEMFSWNGDAKCVGITEKSLTGFPYCVEWRHIFPAPLDAETERAVVSTVRTALTALGVTQGPTHTELKLSARGPAVIEINPRLAGGMIPELVQLVTGTDLLELQIRAALGQAPVLSHANRGHAGIQFLAAPDHGRLAEITGVEAARQVPGVVRVTVTGKQGMAVRPPRSAYDRLGSVIVYGQSRDVVVAGLAEASQRIGIRLAEPVRSLA
jgi:S-sulfo-L-cysteine synthase (3-phospho-L-serine-dependent)